VSEKETETRGRELIINRFNLSHECHTTLIIQNLLPKNTLQDFDFADGADHPFPSTTHAACCGWIKCPINISLSTILLDITLI